MEPLTLTAEAIATLIFSKALETSGERLGEAVSDKIGQLLNLIREKFQKEGVEGKLTKAQELVFYQSKQHLGTANPCYCEGFEFFGSFWI